MKIVHISDTHTYHEQLKIPSCDVLIHSGDIGSRTNSRELVDFLTWLEAQPAIHKIWTAGNHDLCLDRQFTGKNHPVQESFGFRQYEEAISLIGRYKVRYLFNASCEINGCRFYGAPWSPSFHRESWAFNQDRGREISRQWARIPGNVEVLITHTPPQNVLDFVPDRELRYPEENPNVGCEDLWAVIRKRLFSLKLHCFGHIHGNYGVRKLPVSRQRQALFSNGAVLDNNYKTVIQEPVVINI